jgi:hypothetical protein
MKRLFAILALLTGSICAEIAHPVNCNLITSSRSQNKKSK